ncbi:MAG: hypothetical protein ABEK59_07135 [Halobacteria archaeon]
MREPVPPNVSLTEKERELLEELGDRGIILQFELEDKFAYAEASEPSTKATKVKEFMDALRKLETKGLIDWEKVDYWNNYITITFKGLAVLTQEEGYA